MGRVEGLNHLPPEGDGLTQALGTICYWHPTLDPRLERSLTSESPPSQRALLVQGSQIVSRRLVQAFGQGRIGFFETNACGRDLIVRVVPKCKDRVVVAESPEGFDPMLTVDATIVSPPYFPMPWKFEAIRRCSPVLKNGGSLRILISSKEYGAYRRFLTTKAEWDVDTVAASSRVLRVHKWIRDAESPPNDGRLIRETLRGRPLELKTDKGIFASAGIDDGSRFLLSSVEPKPNDRILDVGCGVGVLGLALSQDVHEGSVSMIDADARAVSMAKANIARNGIGNATATCSDLFLSRPPGKTYSLVVSNPPQHVPAILATLLWENVRAGMTPQAEGYVVAQSSMTYGRTLSKVFVETRHLDSNGAFDLWHFKR